MAWAPNLTGYRGGRIKNNLGENIGNQRLLPVDASASTNTQPSSGWKSIANLGAGVLSYAVYPVQTSGGNLDVGVDLASSWMQIEFAIFN